MNATNSPESSSASTRAERLIKQRKAAALDALKRVKECNRLAEELRTSALAASVAQDALDAAEQGLAAALAEDEQQQEAHDRAPSPVEPAVPVTQDEEATLNTIKVVALTPEMARDLLDPAPAPQQKTADQVEARAQRIAQKLIDDVARPTAHANGHANGKNNGDLLGVPAAGESGGLGFFGPRWKEEEATTPPPVAAPAEPPPSPAPSTDEPSARGKKTRKKPSA